MSGATAVGDTSEAPETFEMSETQQGGQSSQTRQGSHVSSPPASLETGVVGRSTPQPSGTLGNLQRRATTAVTDVRANTVTTTLPFQSKSRTGNVARPHVADVGDPRYPPAPSRDTDLSRTDTRAKAATVALKAASTARMVDALAGSRTEPTGTCRSRSTPSAQLAPSTPSRASTTPEHRRSSIRRAIPTVT